MIYLLFKKRFRDRIKSGLIYGISRGNETDYFFSFF